MKTGLIDEARFFCFMTASVTHGCWEHRSGRAYKTRPSPKTNVEFQSGIHEIRGRRQSRYRPSSPRSASRFRCCDPLLDGVLMQGFVKLIHHDRPRGVGA